MIRDDARRRKTAVYLVGGFLRDYVLGRRGLDFDFAVERGGIPFARSFARRIKGAFVLLDKERGCARVVKKTKDKIMTFDFADFRGPTIRADLKHRDFTINTLTCAVHDLPPNARLKDVITDPLAGKKDIGARTIRMVSAGAFREDPLRLLRAFSLKALLDFKIEAKTRRAIEGQGRLIRDVSAERVRDELFKILATDRAAENVHLMDRMGLLQKIIPQVSVMVGVAQGPYHHLDIWKHSLQSVVELEKIFQRFGRDKDVAAYLKEPLGGERTRRALLKLGCLLHDIGKPQSLKKDRQKIYFYGHERVGRYFAKTIALDLKLSKLERRVLQDMVLWHLRPGYLSNFKTPSRRALFRYFRDTGEEAAGIALLSLADQKATRGPLTSAADQRHHEKICRMLMARFFEMKKEKPFVRLITGHDLIKKFRLKPSPVFARILREVEEQQAAGKVTTKKEALSLAAKIVNKKNKKTLPTKRPCKSKTQK